MITLGVGFLALMNTAAACEDPDRPEYVRVCEDENQVRVVDEDCNDNGSGHTVVPGRHWSHYPASSHAPAVGQIGTGRVTPPAGARIGSIPTSGGFGTHAGTVAG